MHVSRPNLGHFTNLVRLIFFMLTREGEISHSVYFLNDEIWNKILVNHFREYIKKSTKPTCILLFVVDGGCIYIKNNYNFKEHRKNLLPLHRPYNDYREINEDTK